MRSFQRNLVFHESEYCTSSDVQSPSRCWGETLVVAEWGDEVAGRL